MSSLELILDQGPAFPSVGALWGQWIPPLERSIIPPIAHAGTTQLEFLHFFSSSISD